MATRKIMKSTLLLSYYGFSFLLLPLFSFLYPPPPQSLCVFLRHSVSTISLVTLYPSNPSPWDLTFSQELRKVSYYTDIILSFIKKIRCLLVGFFNLTLSPF